MSRGSRGSAACAMQDGRSRCGSWRSSAAARAAPEGPSERSAGTWHRPRHLERRSLAPSEVAEQRCATEARGLAGSLALADQTRGGRDCRASDCRASAYLRASSSAKASSSSSGSGSLPGASALPEGAQGTWGTACQPLPRAGREVHHEPWGALPLPRECVADRRDPPTSPPMICKA